jgi:PBP1b-binding outer membrane lipoprotein LpoB
MKIVWAILCIVILAYGCGSKEEATAEKPGEKVREAVKDVVSRDFKTLESAKDALKDSEAKTKTALEAVEKDLK